MTRTACPMMAISLVLAIPLLMSLTSLAGCSRQPDPSDIMRSDLPAPGPRMKKQFILVIMYDKVSMRGISAKPA